MQFQRLLANQATRFTSYIQKDIEFRIPAIVHMAKRWEYKKGMSDKEFLFDAAQYVKDFTGMKALAWANKDYIIKLVEPLLSNEKMYDFDLKKDPQMLPYLDKTLQTKRPVMSSVINLPQSRTGIVIYFPLFINNNFEGYIISVFDTNDWFGSIFLIPDESINKDFKIRIEIDGVDAYHNNGEIDPESALYASANMKYMGHVFTVYIQPTEQLKSSVNYNIPNIFFLAGVLLSAMVVFMIYLYQRAEEYAIATEKTKKELEIQQQHLADIIEGTNVGTWEWYVPTGETKVNKKWPQIIGYTLDEISPLSFDKWQTFVNPHDLEKSKKIIEKLFNKKLDYYENELRLRHKNGSWVWVLDRAKVTVWTEDGQPYLMAGTTQDISKRKAVEERIAHMANHDALTDLPTIRLANDRLHQAIEYSNRKQLLLAVVFIDLNGFKPINDNYGHDAGDLVLRSIAHRIVSCVRGVDTVARIGGDEFLVILSGLHKQENVVEIVNKILNKIEEPIILSGDTLTISGSIGISMYPDHRVDPKTLIKLSDAAMYEIKKSNKRGYKFA